MHEMSEYPSTFLEPGRRKLPPTPSRRSSSPRMLPTPPPVSPELRPPSSHLERPPSRRKLPVPPVAAENEWPIPSPVIQPPPVVKQVSVTEKTVSEKSPPIIPRKFSEMQENFTAIRLTRPLLLHQENSLDHSAETPSSTNAPSQSSSLSPSMEQLTSKSSSEADDLSGLSAAHGIDPALYQRAATASSSSVPDIVNATVVPTSSSWPETEPRPSGLGHVQATIQHFPIRKRLRVSILKAEGLAGQLKPELEIHPYCKVSLMPGGKPQNSVVKRGRNAVFNQEFFFDGIATEDLESKELNVTVFHQANQKLQKDVLIGDIDIQLKNLIELRLKKEVKIVEELKYNFSTKKLGKLYITSCIEKDARRLTINLLKADDLPKGGITGPPDVCVRIRVTQGGTTQMKQSRVLKNTCSAVYKEAVMFLIKTKREILEDTSILISVHDLSRTITGDDLIGLAYLGKNAQDKSEIEQWKSTIDHLGKEYKGTHHLKPTPRAPDVLVDHAPSDTEE